MHIAYPGSLAFMRVLGVLQGRLLTQCQWLITTTSGSAIEAMAFSLLESCRRRAPAPGRVCEITKTASWTRSQKSDGSPSGCFVATRLAGLGRKGKFAAFGCSRSARFSCRMMETTRERPLSPPLALSAARPKVKFQGRSVARREIGHGQQWVESPTSQARTAVARVA